MHYASAMTAARRCIPCLLLALLSLAKHCMPPFVFLVLIGRECNLVFHARASSSQHHEALLYFPGQRRGLVVAYLLLLFGGIFGLHWLYLGEPRLYRLYICTLGLGGIGVRGWRLSLSLHN